MNHVNFELQKYCSKFVRLIRKYIQSNLVKMINSGPAIFVRYNVVCFNLVEMCTKMTYLTLITVRYNRVFINNRVRYNWIWMYVDRIHIRTYLKFLSVSVTVIHCSSPSDVTEPLQHCKQNWNLRVNWINCLMQRVIFNNLILHILWGNLVLYVRDNIQSLDINT